VNWLQWSEETFKTAQSGDKPVLLSIHAVWCYWCHVMDDTTYSDVDIAEYINENFIPIRVDNDHQPDINTRYNVGGWPSTVFLTPHGGSIAGITYLPPDQLLPMLGEIQRAYKDQKTEIYDHCNNQIRQRQSEVSKVEYTTPIDLEMVDNIARKTAGTYDPIFGGFGDSPKFPSAPILKFVSHLYRTTQEPFYKIMLEKTLDNMITEGIMDRHGRGFFRYSASRDWNNVQHEKMLEDNIGLIQVYTEAYSLLGKDSYLNTAISTMDYILEELYDPSALGIRGSQGAHSDYFGLSKDHRINENPPPPDPYCYIHSSALAASMLLESGWKLSRPDAISTGVAVLNNIDTMAKNNSLFHAFSSQGPNLTSSNRLLLDWAHLLNALADASIYAPKSDEYLERAVEVAHQMIEMFYDEQKGAFFDRVRDTDSIGFVRIREKHLPENLIATQGLVKLYNANGNKEYYDMAHRTLSAFVETNGNYGEHAASYGLSIDTLLNEPVEITIEGHYENQTAIELLHEISRIPQSNIKLKLISTDKSTAAKAHVCIGTTCIPPVNNPEDLSRAISNAVIKPDDPFTNLMEEITNV